MYSSRMLTNRLLTVSRSIRGCLTLVFWGCTPALANTPRIDIPHWYMLGYTPSVDRQTPVKTLPFRLVTSDTISW